MAVLKLYSDIQTEEQKAVARWFGEIEGTSFNDVAAFCEALPEDDPVIEVQLHSNGGSVSEGWSIYDRLRATGKEIHAVVEGKAASMATVILMAAPKEHRRSYENAAILIHNPYVLAGGTFTADELAKLEKDMRKDQEKILDLYVERCSEADDDDEKRAALREELQKVMDENLYITPRRAMELGIIGEIIKPVSARAGMDKFNKNQTKEKMAKEEKKTVVKQSLLDKMLAKLGFKSIDDVTFGMDLNTADGEVLTIEREEGEPKVGDKAAPDGEHVMPDGSTIVVVEGVITDIKPADTGAEEDGDEEKGAEEGDENEVAALQARIDELEAENEDLKKQLEEAGKSAKSKQDMMVLNAVKMAGGIDKVLGKVRSGFKPATRKVEKVLEDERGEKSGMEKELEALRSGKLRNKGGRYIKVED